MLLLLAQVAALSLRFPCTAPTACTLSLHKQIFLDNLHWVVPSVPLQTLIDETVVDYWLYHYHAPWQKAQSLW